MALRLIEMILPQEDQKVAHELLKEFKIISVWDEKSSENRLFVKLLVPIPRRKLNLCWSGAFFFLAN